jgi:hypothetical protein
MRVEYDIEPENDPVRSWRRRVAGVSGDGEARATSTCCAPDRVRARAQPLAERAGVPRFSGQPGPHGLTFRCILFAFRPDGARRPANIFSDSLLNSQRVSAGFVVPAQPSKAPKSPVGTDSVHEIKHDGYGIIEPGRSNGARLYSRNE